MATILYIIGVIAILVALFRAMSGQGSKTPPKCRACNQVKPLAITYETDGVCGECLNEALKLQGLGGSS